jgi:hypothetical protein
MLASFYHQVPTAEELVGQALLLLTMAPPAVVVQLPILLLGLAASFLLDLVIVATLIFVVASIVV